jgi:hypothetical protein
MAFSFPRDRAEVRMLLVYEGLRVRGDKPEDLARAKKQLTELFVDRQEFWLGTPELPFPFSLRAPRDGNDKPALALLRKHVAIDRSGLFTLPDGRPCAYQTLTIRDPDKLAAALNAEISSEMAGNARQELAKPATETTADFDRETWRLVERACRGKFDWLRVEPGRFSVTIPASPEFSRKTKAWFLGLETLGDVEAALRRGRPKLDESADLFRLFRDTRARLGDLADAPWSFDQRKDQFTVSLGYGGGEAILLTSRRRQPLPSNPLDKDLHAFIRRLEIPFRDKTEVAALVEEFLKGTLGGREK